MQIIKKAIQEEINAMSHEPEKMGNFERVWGFRAREIDWGNVYDRALDLLEEEVDIDSLPADIYLEPSKIIDQIIDEYKDSQWVQDMLDEARQGYQEGVELQENPYKVYGIPKHDF